MKKLMGILLTLVLMASGTARAIERAQPTTDQVKAGTYKIAFSRALYKGRNTSFF